MTGAKSKNMHDLVEIFTDDSITMIHSIREALWIMSTLSWKSEDR
jgi:hypothetical protein